MEWLLFWIVMAFIVAIVGASKGRNGALWFLYGFLIWPVALIHGLCLSKTREAELEDAADAGRRPCPKCAELILREATICRFCGSDVTPAAAAPVAEG